MSLFTQFMGRKPSANALMRHKCLAHGADQKYQQEGNYES